jgi:FtsH-binding integral membrane protein
MNDDLMRRYNNFSSKVYLCLGSQLFLTFGLVLDNNRKNIVFSESTVGLSFLGMLITYYLSYISVITSQSNFVKMSLLGIFSVCESIIVTNWTKNFSYESILTMLLTTGTVFSTLSLFSINQRENYSVYKGIAFNIINGLLLLSILGFIFYSNLINIIFTVLTIVLISLYVIMDAQYMLLTDSYYFANDAYTMVSLKLYTDFVLLFIRLIRLFGRGKFKLI